MKNISIAVIILLVCSSTFCQQLFRFNTLSQERGAACLDGSPPGYYIDEGKGQNKNSYLIYFKGGGYCGEVTLQKTLESCYSRSFTERGSTKNVSPTFNSTGFGIVSNIKSENTLFFDWTKLVVNYCDGHEYVGHRENPVQYKNKLLYFRGSRNVKQLFIHLSQKYDFYNGNKIIIGGRSAGAMCAFQWINYLKQNTKKAQIFAIPDSGFFITDYYTPIVQRKAIRQTIQPLFNLVYNYTEMPDPIQKCMQNKEFDIVDCLNVGNYFRYLKAPLFLVQSAYDSFSLKNIVKAQCMQNKKDPASLKDCNSTQRTVIEDYRLRSIQYLKNMKKQGPPMSIWGPACAQHCFAHEQNSYNAAKYIVKQKTLMESIKRFLQDPQKTQWLLDQQPWPLNTGCSGLDKQYSEER